MPKFDKDKPVMGKIKQERNPALDRHNKEYDPKLAKRRNKEKARRKTNQLNRRRGS